MLLKKNKKTKVRETHYFLTRESVVKSGQLHTGLGPISAHVVDTP